MAVEGTVKALVYDQDGSTLLAEIEKLQPPQWTRSRNGADQFDIVLPRNDPKVSHCVLLNEVHLYADDALVNIGLIYGRSFDDDWLTVNCFTEEMILTRLLMPDQYGYALTSENADLADAVAEFAFGFEIIRLKSTTQWTGASHFISSSNIDTTTNPGWVILGESSPGTYYASGNIIVEFDIADVNSFQHWDRLRWLADYDHDGPVQVTMAYSANGGASWSAEVPGALTDTVGYVIPDLYISSFQIRFTLTTTDTTKTPIVYMTEVIARTNIGLALESGYPGSTGKTTPTVVMDGGSMLDSLIELCRAANYEFKVFQKEIHLQEKFGIDRSNSIILRAP